MLKGRKFGSTGAYVRRFVPKLARLPDRWLHRPWDAPAAVLHGAGVALGQSYALPVIDHAAGCVRALAAFAAIGDRAAGDDG